MSTGHGVRSTGHIGSGSPKSDQNTISHSHLQLPVDRPRAQSTEHIGEMSTWSLQVDWARCVWGRPGQLWWTFWKGSFDPILDGLRWDFGYPFLTHLTLCEDVLNRHSSWLIRLYQKSTSLNLERHGTTEYPSYIYTRRLFVPVSWTLIPFVNWVGWLMLRV